MDIIIGKEFADKVIPYVDEAKKNIDIVMFDWRWYASNPNSAVSRFNQSVVRAVNRGVSVRAIVNNADILPRLSTLGIKAGRAPYGRLLHAKIMYIEEKVLITGSHNYTQSGFQTNLEISVVLESADGFPRIGQFVDNLI